MKRMAPVFALALAFAARADEGMWTYDNFPSARVAKKYGFGPDQKWLDEARLSSVRLAGGCSGSFVSPVACRSSFRALARRGAITVLIAVAGPR